MKPWRVICDRCATKRWSGDLRKEWTGLMVCADTCWEPRNPQDFVKGVPDKQNPPWVRPEPADVFIPSFGFMLYEDGTIMLFEDDAGDVLAPSRMSYEDAE